MDGTDKLKHLPLRALHEELGGSFVPFAGWEMPVRYGPGVMAEHLWCREKAGLFDVSHMGQVMLPPGADEALEALVPMDVIGLAEGRQRYAFFTNDAGGLLDDLMIARHAEGLHLVVNAACADADIAHLERHVPGVRVLSDRALLALQGPMAWRCLRDCCRRSTGCGSWMCCGWTGTGRALDLALGLHRRGRVRNLPAIRGGGGLRAQADGQPRRRAHRPRRARHAAAGGRVAALWAGPRPRHHAGRGGPDWAIQKVRRPVARARAAIRGRMSSRPNWPMARRAGAWGSCRRAGADARRNGGFRDG
jgi:hypothetical protein